MIHATIQTKYDNRHFVPGETIPGHVTWDAAAGEGADGAELHLLYYTEGKGSRDARVVDTRKWEPGAASAAGEAFEFVLPAGPYSFSGRLISLSWALELVVGSAGHAERLEIIVSPTAKEIDLNRYPVPAELDDEGRAKKWLRKRMERRA